MKVQDPIPRQEKVEARPEGMEFVLAAPHGGPIDVMFELNPLRVGACPVRVGVQGGPMLDLPQFIYP